MFRMTLPTWAEEELSFDRSSEKEDTVKLHGKTKKGNESILPVVTKEFSGLTFTIRIIIVIW